MPTKKKEQFEALVLEQISKIKNDLAEVSAKLKGVRIETNKRESITKTPFMKLTVKQHAVAQMVLTGCSIKEMAERMETSESTVKVHMRTIYGYFGVNKKDNFILVAKPMFDPLDPDEYKDFAGLRKDWAAKFRERDPANEVIRSKKYR